jgi:hypothetical protein
MTGAAAEKLVLAQRQIRLLEEQNKQLGNIARELKRQRDSTDTIRAAVMAPIRREVATQMQSKQLDFMDTIDVLRDERKSFARYGDGEFRLMYRREHKLKFHRNSPELMAALERVLVDPAPGTLIGMPHFFTGVHWSIVFAETWHHVGPLLAGQERFGQAHVTRPMFFEEYGRDAVEAWRSVWAGRDAVLVTGTGSRFDLVPALFGSLASTHEIFSTPTDAFHDLPRLIDEIEASGRDLVLLSLGPAATVAADMLARRGIQALDIGHLSASYENVFEGKARPEEMPTVRS